MEKQETEMKRKLEQKWEQKNTNHWSNVFFIMCLVIIVVFYSAMDESHAFPSLLYCAS